MGQITSGVGQISGLPISDIIDQLIAIEARPKQIVEQRIAVLQSQQIAFQDINAKLLALKLSASGFSTNKTFGTTTALSSNEAALSAISVSSATPGTYSFIVDRLVSTQQIITKGFVDQDVTAVGTGTLNFEFGDACLDTDTDLTALNGGSGVVRGRIRIIDRSGASAEVDLGKVQTVNDVLDAINTASGISVTASVSGDKLVVDDTSGSTTTALTVADIATSGVTAAFGLDAVAAGNKLTGNQINILTVDSSLSQLNDEQGVDINKKISGHMQFRLQDNSAVTIDLTGVTTMQQLIDAIETGSSNVIDVQINTGGTGIELTDTGVDLGFDFESLVANGSNAAKDLGIFGIDTDGDGKLVSGRLLAEINSKLVKNINGGVGATLGEISITNRDGMSTSVMLSSADSISQVIDLINTSGANVLASLNAAGNGILLDDQTGSEVYDLVVTDVSGTGATDLNLAGSHDGDQVDSGNLQFRYISGRTALASLNGGLGVSSGRFIITDSSGGSATVDLSQSNEIIVQDVLDEINSRGLLINARVNDHGDGILIEDIGPGSVKLKVIEDGSTTAADLGILGEVTNFSEDLDGTFEKTVTVNATDTLSDVVTAINNAGIGARATVINDGSATAPFRLILTATQPGRAGAFVFDDGALDFGATILSGANDALVFFGSDDAANGIAIRSSTNSLNTTIPGVSIDLNGTSSDTTVTVTINYDETAITSVARSFVEDFNAVMETLDTYDNFDSETGQRGLLLGDSTVGMVRNALFRLVTDANSDLTGQFNSLAQVGIHVGAGARLQFNEARFLEAMESDRDAVEAVFTFKETGTDETSNMSTITAAGILVHFDELLSTFTDGTGGIMQRRLDAMQDQIKINTDRIEQLDRSLEAKRARLEAEFLAMERAIAALQSQSAALASLQDLAASVNTF